MNQKMQLLVCILCGITVLAGCGQPSKGLSKEEANRYMQQELQNKYGETVRILSLEEKDDGQNFSHKYYWAEAEISEGDLFHIKMEKNGTEIEDDFESLLYDDEIQNRVKQIIDSVSGLSVNEYEIRYELSDAVADDVEEYLKNGNAILQMTVAIQEDTKRKSAESAYALVDSLSENYFGYSVRFLYENQSFGLVYDVGDEPFTKEQILNKMDIK